VGRLPQVPGVFSQGGTLAGLEETGRDAYKLMVDEQECLAGKAAVQRKEIEVSAHRGENSFGNWNDPVTR